MSSPLSHAFLYKRKTDLRPLMPASGQGLRFFHQFLLRHTLLRDRCRLRPPGRLCCHPLRASLSPFATPDPALEVSGSLAGPRHYTKVDLGSPKIASSEAILRSQHIATFAFRLRGQDRKTAAYSRLLDARQFIKLLSGPVQRKSAFPLPYLSHYVPSRRALRQRPCLRSRDDDGADSCIFLKSVIASYSSK